MSIVGNIGNWIGERCATVGTGVIGLGGALDGFVRFDNLPDGLVWYTIVDGENREAGLGTLSNDEIVRTTIFATFENGAYSEAGTPITLSGNSDVYCTFNAAAMNEMNAGLLKLDGIEVNATADQIAAEVPFTPVGILSTSNVQLAIEELDAKKLSITDAVTEINQLSDVDTTGKLAGRILEFDASGNIIVGLKEPGIPTTSFLDLVDTPFEYDGQEGKSLVVDDAGLTVVFTDAPQLDSIAKNNALYAASGAVHFGRHTDLLNINEGLSTNLLVPNSLLFGGSDGDSLTEFPVMNIAGFVDSLSDVPEILFGDAPNSADLTERVDVFCLVTTITNGKSSHTIQVLEGAGNGDWLNIDCTKGQLEFDASNQYPYFTDPLHQGVFKHSSEEEYLYVLGAVLRLNKGAHHPSFNPLGTALLYPNNTQSGARKWWQSDAWPISSTADCFDPLKCNFGTGSTSQAVARDDGRGYDGIYSSGQGGVNDYRLSAWDKSTAEDSAKVMESIKLGIYRGAEELAYTTITTNIGSTNAAADLVRINQAEGKTPKVGGRCSHIVGTVVQTWRASQVLSNSEGTWDIYVDGTISRTNGAHIVYEHGTDTDTTVSGEFTMTDVIGDPANILLTPDLANGWPGGWIPYIPDGVQTAYALTRKALGAGGNVLDSTATVDNGTTWAAVTRNLDAVANVCAVLAVASQVEVVTYTAFAKQTKESVNKPVLNGSAGVLPVSALADTNTATGIMLGESLIGKVNTNGVDGTKTNTLFMNALPLDPRTSTFYQTGVTHYYGKSSHEPLTLTMPTNGSGATKVLPYQINNNGQTSLGFHANELTWEAKAIISTTEAVALNGRDAGDVIRIDSGTKFLHGVFQVKISSTQSLALSSWSRDIRGIHYSPTGATYATEWNLLTSPWGDDSTMKITASGTETFPDLNGNTNIQTVHELAKPYGYVKDKA